MAVACNKEERLVCVKSASAGRSVVSVGKERVEETI